MIAISETTDGSDVRRYIQQHQQHTYIIICRENATLKPQVWGSPTFAPINTVYCVHVHVVTHDMAKGSRNSNYKYSGMQASTINIESLAGTWHDTDRPHGTTCTGHTA